MIIKRGARKSRSLLHFLLLSLSIATVAAGLGRAARQAAAAPQPALSKYVPSGGLLYLEVKNFSSLLADWNGSPQKKEWLRSSNYQVFSRSRLLLRLRDAGNQFANAAGLLPDMNFLNQTAGRESAMALYDIGKLQFLFITRLPSANSMQSQLWQTRSKFETRKAGDTTFYLRREVDSEREVAFAITGDYLLLSTREDLMASALQLMAGGAVQSIEGRSIESEPWWSQSVAAAGARGDLRMVLNLEKIVPSPYFRSYWVQQNITDLRQYAAAVSDLFRDSGEYREERVLLKRVPGDKVSTEPSSNISDLLALIPDNAGAYETRSRPPVEACVEQLETKLFAARLGPVSPQTAPQAQLTSGETGSSFDMETRIDQPLLLATTNSAEAAALRDLLQQNPVQATLEVQSSERAPDGVFVRIHSAVVLRGSSDWDEANARLALADFVRRNVTTGELGAGWRQASGYFELDGLRPLMSAVLGKYLIVSDNSALIGSMLANMNRKVDASSAVFIAGFNHTHEKENFSRLAATVERPDRGDAGEQNIQRTPQFFSENIASLSSTLEAVSSERIVVRAADDKVFQTVTYKWAQ